MFINVVLNALPKGECKHLHVDTIYNLEKSKWYIVCLEHISLPEVITGTPASEYQIAKKSL